MIRRSKYGVRHDAAGIAARTYGGVLFHSKLERQRYVELLMLEKGGHISVLRRQVPFSLYAWNMATTRPEHVGTYVCDFTYNQNGTLIYEDAKGMRTPAYLWKKRMMKACYGIEITEWPARPARRRKR